MRRATVDRKTKETEISVTVDLDGTGPSFVARGAENNKGPLAGMLAVVKDLADRGALTVNVEILLEGEDELHPRLRAVPAEIVQWRIHEYPGLRNKPSRRYFTTAWRQHPANVATEMQVARCRDSF